MLYDMTLGQLLSLVTTRTNRELKALQAQNQSQQRAVAAEAPTASQLAMLFSAG